MQDDYCIHDVNYTVVLQEGVTGIIVEQKEVHHDRCNNGFCAITFFPLTTMGPYYIVHITATNIVGTSDEAVSSTEISKCKKMF